MGKYKFFPWYIDDCGDMLFIYAKTEIESERKARCIANASYLGLGNDVVAYVWNAKTNQGYMHVTTI